MAKTHVKKGDMVYILNGKDGGKKGKVLSVIPSDGKVLVEGVNIVSKHVKPNPAKGLNEGGIIHQEAPIYVGKVMLICKHCGKPTKVGKKLMDDGSKARVCKKCDSVIDIIGEGKE
ncbi:MAG: 50S ribosomal protein L24 [Clostridiaceae bacterium]|jgi:large subunit ribosomal protein L24|nr:50S ribosomal protein L24 [Clostridiaceae bacterium]